MHHMDVSIDYHVWGTMLEHYQRHMPKLANVMPRKKTVLSTIQNDLHEFTDKVIVSLHQTLIVCCCNWWALTLRTIRLNTEWAMGIWYSWLKHLNCWWKAVKNWFVIRAYSMCNCMFTWTNCCNRGTISVISIKFAGYVGWIFAYKVW